jgi:nucleoside-diphosphate-sugar epimerase
VTTILVTGADGFLGSRLSTVLELRGYAVRRAIRSHGRSPSLGAFVTGDLASFTGWPQLVSGVDTIVHLAARAHVLKRESLAEIAAYRAVNVDATIGLAEAAAGHGVRRFVFVSSIGVNGNETRGRAFTDADVPAPTEPYATSKWEAERALAYRQANSGMELVIVRPPLIYGPGVKGNLLRLLNLLARGLPLPLGALRRPRNFIGRDNLCDFLEACAIHPRAAGEVFLAAEPERRSTAELLNTIATAMGYRNRVWWCPLPLLGLAARAVGKRPELAKLAAALEVDSSKAIRVLGWTPRVRFDEGIAETVAWFMGTRR